MINKDKINKCWQPLIDSLSGIEDYYGIKLSQRTFDNILNDLVNDLIRQSEHYLPEKFYANCVDGTIKYGYAPNDRLSEILKWRYYYEGNNIDGDIYERLLLKTDEKYTYCTDNETFYYDINPLVGRYIMRHNLSHRVIHLVTNGVKMPEIISGDLVKVFSKYIKMERSIHDKKYTLADSLPDLFTKSDIESDYFPLIYYDKKFYIEDSKTPYYGELLSNDADFRYELSTRCMNLDIEYFNATRLVNIGESIEYALKKGLEDKEKYGFIYDKLNKQVVYSLKDLNMKMYSLNYNFVKYIEYLAKQEEKELGIGDLA